MPESSSPFARRRLIIVTAVIVTALVAGGLVLTLFGKDGGRSKQASPGTSAMAAHRGTPIDPGALAILDQTVMPDGTGLPPGQGTPTRGREIYEGQCSYCHGPEGRGGIGDIPALTGGVGSLASSKPIRTLNSFWPYAPPAFDYIRRAMPPTAPRSLSNDDVYAVLGYLLSVDGIVPATAPVTKQSLAKLRMPNRDGFEDLR